MKIGILTFHNAYNFGALLQAYALETFLERQGNTVEILDYHNPHIDKAYVYFDKKSLHILNPFKSLKYIAISYYRKKKYSEFRKYVLTLLNISQRLYNLNDSAIREKDIVIVGSDQLWNKNLTGNNDLFYWGEFTKFSRARAITYAVSMNSDSLTPSDLDFVRSHLANFSALSVRETDLADKLRPLTSKTIHVSLDPTLIVDSDIWRELIKEGKGAMKKPYVLVYAILERKKVIECARIFALKHNLNLVMMRPIAEVMPFSGFYQPSSPLDFLSAIAQADYVFTSSFHGLAFSIIFHREVYVMGDSGKNERMKSLLNGLDIGNRFIENDDNIPLSKINYDIVENKLATLRSISQKYLIEELDILKK